MYVCVCVCVCMSMCMCTCRCICICICFRIRIRIRMCVCMYACMHACNYVCMYVCMYGIMYACMHECMHVYMCVCARTSTCIQVEYGTCTVDTRNRYIDAVSLGKVCADFLAGSGILRKSAALSARKFASNSVRRAGRACENNVAQTANPKLYLRDPYMHRGRLDQV